MSLRVGILSAICLLTLTATGFSQGNPTGPTPAGVGSVMSGVSTRGSGGGMSIKLSVVDEKMNRLSQPSVVKMYDETMKHNTWQPTDKSSSAEFDELQVGKYDFEVSSIGYLTSRKEFQIDSLRDRTESKVQVVLYPDPDAVELGLGDMPEKAAKEAQKGISDFKSANFKDAQKHFENANKQAPDNTRTNFLLGYLYFQQNNYAQAQTYLTKATTTDPKDVQVLNLIGRLHLAQKDYAGAKTALEQAVAASPDNPTAHSLLAGAYFNLGDFKNALAEANTAIDKGKSPTTNAQIVKGEALANLGKYQEAVDTLKAYLQAAPDTIAGPGVSQLIANLEQRLPNQPGGSAPATKQ